MHVSMAGAAALHCASFLLLAREVEIPAVFWGLVAVIAGC